MDYPSAGFGASYADKPWMAVSRTSGRLWLVWRAINTSEGPYCVATSLNGSQWSSCVRPSPGSGAMTVAANGPDSAVVAFEGEASNLVVSTCTAPSGSLTVTCTSPSTAAPYHEVSGGELLSVPSGFAAGALFTAAGDEASGDVAIVWGERNTPGHAQTLWIHRSGSGWTSPQSITAPTADQIMQAVAYMGASGEWGLTFYQRRSATSHLFDVVGYQYSKSASAWQSLGTLSGGPVSADMAGNWFGDYAWLECPTTCMSAYTGTNTSTTPNQPQIVVSTMNPKIPCLAGS